MLYNKFDCFIIIEGRRGLGKSTLAYEILTRVSSLISRSNLENKKYIFNPRKDILFSQDEVLNAITKRWHDSFILDEMINVTFNRDFYSESQKKIIKAMNMNRDHCNLICSCVPQFATLDNQIRNLCKIRITVVRRGFCVIHTPNKTIYSKDVWDTQLNEKIEREWMGKTVRPKYSRLTTFRGLMKFPDLMKTSREIYEEIKVNKRNEIMMSDEAKPVKEDPFTRVFEMLKENKFANRREFDMACIVAGMKPTNVQVRVGKALKNEGADKKFTDYFKTRAEKVAEIQQQRAIPIALR